MKLLSPEPPEIFFLRNDGWWVLPINNIGFFLWGLLPFGFLKLFKVNLWLFGIPWGLLWAFLFGQGLGDFHVLIAFFIMVYIGYFLIIRLKPRLSIFIGHLFIGFLDLFFLHFFQFDNPLKFFFLFDIHFWFVKFSDLLVELSHSLYFDFGRFTERIELQPLFLVHKFYLIVEKSLKMLFSRLCGPPRLHQQFEFFFFFWMVKWFSLQVLILVLLYFIQTQTSPVLFNWFQPFLHLLSSFLLMHFCELFLFLFV